MILYFDEDRKIIAKYKPKEVEASTPNSGKKPNEYGIYSNI